jgi:hypothetical protein
MRIECATCTSYTGEVFIQEVVAHASQKLCWEIEDPRWQLRSVSNSDIGFRTCSTIAVKQYDLLIRFGSVRLYSFLASRRRVSSSDEIAVTGKPGSEYLTVRRRYLPFPALLEPCGALSLQGIRYRVESTWWLNVRANVIVCGWGRSCLFLQC